MDEFDIFMDAMSRNAAMKQILVFATEHCHRQFILITPQVRLPFPPNPTPCSCSAGGMFCIVSVASRLAAAAETAAAVSGTRVGTPVLPEYVYILVYTRGLEGASPVQ